MNIVKKVLKSIGILFMIIVTYLITAMFISFDRSIYVHIYNYGLLTLTIIMLLNIWTIKFKKVLHSIIYIVLALLIWTCIYYQFISIRVEPLIYLHNTYDFKLKEMKILKTTAFYEPLLCLDACNRIPRSATILVNEKEIYVYYNSMTGWTDNYDDILKGKEADNKITSEFDKTIKNYINDYIIINGIPCEECPYSDFIYSIYFYTEDKDVVSGIMSDLNNYITELHTNNPETSYYVSYRLIYTKNQDLYNIIKSNYNDDVRNNKDTNVYLDVDIPAITGHEHTIISSYRNEWPIIYNDGFNPDVFDNNGNIKDEGYINSSLFKYVLFNYDCEPNEVRASEQLTTIYGIK